MMNNRAKLDTSILRHTVEGGLHALLDSPLMEPDSSEQIPTLNLLFSFPRRQTAAATDQVMTFKLCATLRNHLLKLRPVTFHTTFLQTVVAKSEYSKLNPPTV